MPGGSALLCSRSNVTPEQARLLLHARGHLAFGPFANRQELAETEKAMCLGDYIPFYDGRQSETHVRVFEGLESHASERGAQPVEPHTDGPMYEVPPKWLALWKLGASRPPVPTALASILGFFASQSGLPFFPEAQERLVSFRKRLPGKDTIWEVTRKIADNARNKLLFRYSNSSLAHGATTPRVGETLEPNKDTWARDLAQTATPWFKRNSIEYDVPVGYALFFSNHLNVHYRNREIPLPQGRSRHLIRHWLGDAPGSCGLVPES